jgi:hypothetical protein
MTKKSILVELFDIYKLQTSLNSLLVEWLIRVLVVDYLHLMQKLFI